MLSIILFILVLAGLILVHELGHFAAAKLFGVKVDEFSIGFPPRILSVQKGETKYSLGLLFIGGYVRIHGEDPDEGAGDPRALSSRSRFTQALVVFAGVFMNFIAAWLLLSVGYMAGMPASATTHVGVGNVTDVRPTVVMVLPDSPAAKAGIEGGDVVESIETGTVKLDMRVFENDPMRSGFGNEIGRAQAIQSFIGEHPDESIVIGVLRNGEEKTFLVKAAEGVVEGRKAVGVQLDDVGVLRLPPHLALVQGAVLGKNLLALTAGGLAAFLGQLISGSANFNEVSGPIGIVSVGGAAVDAGLSSVLIIAASISLSLGVLNLVPIPGLDGGRLLILGIESVTRRRVPMRVAAFLSLVGFALLIMLMLIVSYHDIARLVG